MFHLTLHEKKPIPHLADKIAKQKASGGRLVLYRRAWSFLFVSMTQDRIEHVPINRNRALAGWYHSLFTLLFGIWSFAGLVTAPLLLILNLRGGLDVTARFSDTSIDPLRALPPDPNLANQELRIAQWTFVLLGFAFIVGMLYFCGIIPHR